MDNRQSLTGSIIGAQSIADALGHPAFNGENVPDMAAALWALAEMLGDLADRVSAAETAARRAGNAALEEDLAHV